ncbi:MAG: type II toxin-antitoxin system VapC family toxin [Lachnospiraceae bacterium]|nr:type II toxin-antitoxin system VapC family toxin [Ruminococcus sp.]MCM1277181.1 type II toxin-antitoxin system VapC family toxin [Lachnospiraceae bacterium]
MKYMLDTNMCIYAQKGVPSVVAKIGENYKGGLVISSITLAELEYGIEASAAYEKNLRALQGLLAVLDVVSFDDAAAVHYGKICAYLRQKGTPIGTMDMLIAAHARALGYTVVTNNVREFERVPNLQIENWIE